MKLFKSRLKELGIMLLFSVILIALCFVPFGFILLSGHIHEDLPGILVTLIVFGLIGFWVLRGLYWLFIEPFRKPKE